jgi:hypothetical protein
MQNPAQPQSFVSQSQLPPPQAPYGPVAAPSSASWPPEPGVYNPGVVQGMAGGMAPVVMPTPNSKKKRWLLGGAAAVVLVVAGLAFGWYLPNTPTNAFKTGIGRTGTMVSDIVDAATSKDALASYKTTAITGTANASFDGDSFSGTFHSTFDKVSSDNGLDITLKDTSGGSDQTKQLSVKALTQIPSGKTYPDVYFQVSGLRDLGFDADFPQLTQYDGKWILVSSDYLKSIGDGYLKTTDNTSQQITADDVTAFAKATAGVTKDYVFSTKKDKAVLVEKSFVGKENMDGVNTYHYKAALNAANAKAYCVALDNAVFGTQVYKKIMAGDTQAMADDRKNAGKDCSDSVNSTIKDYPTFDMWVEGHYKLLHKIRLYDPSNKTAYTDIGQTYKGGNKLAFFTNYSDAKHNTTGSFTFDTDTDTDVSNANFSIKNTSQDSPYSVSFKLQAKAQSNPVKITKPANATSIQDVLKALGFASDPQALANNSSDSTVETDIDALDSHLGAYYAVNAYYPTLAQLNSASWRSANLPGFDSTALTPPNSSATTLAATATQDQFGYAASGCDTNGCQSYTLTGLLSDGSPFSKQSLATSSDVTFTD